MRWFINTLKQHFYLVLVLVTLVSILLSYTASNTTLSVIYSLGLSVKELILFLLPLLIFGCGFRCVTQLKNDSTKILLYLIGLIVLSNFVASWFGYAFIHFMPISLSQVTANSQDTVMPLWQFTLFKPIPNRIALLGGILFAIVLRAFPIKNNGMITEKINRMTLILLNQILLPILPLFMMGFLTKMLADGSLDIIFQQYLELTLILVLSYSVYLISIFTILEKGKIKRALRHMGHLIPASWLGFSTLSGLAALPLSIQCSEKNIRHKPLAGGVLPLSSNVHLIGESLTLTILSLLVYWMHFGTMPGIVTFMHYAIMWSISAFSIAAVPAGSIMVMIPVFASVLGFDANMIAYMTLIYLFIEPISTIINIMGNGFLVILIDRIYGLRKPETLTARQSINTG